MSKHVFSRTGFSLIAVVAAMVLLSCGGNKKNIVDVDELHRRDSLESAMDTLQLLEDQSEPPMTVDGLFDDFFFTFVTNQSFQMQRIRFPLPVSDSDGARMVRRDGWDEYNKFIFQEQFSVIFEDDDDLMVKNDTSVRRVSVELINLQTSKADVYTFRKDAAVWMLSTIDEVDVEDLPNGLFLDFFVHFMNDSVFQQRSIDEPLRVITSHDTEEDLMTEEKYEAADWHRLKHNYPLPKAELVNIDYGQPSNGVRHKQLLLQSMNDDLYMKFTFHKYRTDWKLIEIDN